LNLNRYVSVNIDMKATYLKCDTTEIIQFDPLRKQERNESEHTNARIASIPAMKAKTLTYKVNLNVKRFESE
jgi:hypothetical protein